MRRARAQSRSSAAARRAGAAPPASRERLLRSGLALAQRDGLRALSVRGVAARAGANLGSFVYHFGTREAFVAELIESWYAPFYARLQAAAASAQGTALERLRGLLLQFVEFMTANRRFVSQVLMDAAAGEKPARAFMQSLSQRHPRVLLRAIVEAQAAGALRREDPANVLLFLFGSLLLPMLFVTGLARAGILPRELGPKLQAKALDPAALAARLDWALRGLTPEAAARARGAVSAHVPAHAPDQSGTQRAEEPAPPSGRRSPHAMSAQRAARRRADRPGSKR